jgi:uncharacterized protein YjiS (DUF1127 family)
MQTAFRPPASRARRQVPFLRLLLEMFCRRRQHEKTYLELSELDERLLYNLGIDPADVRDALEGRPGPSVLMHPMRASVRPQPPEHAP